MKYIDFDVQIYNNHVAIEEILMYLAHRYMAIINLQ